MYYLFKSFILKLKAYKKIEKEKETVPWPRGNHLELGILYSFLLVFALYSLAPTERAVVDSFFHLPLHHKECLHIIKNM